MDDERSAIEKVILGVGGAGSNIVDQLANSSLPNVTTVALNTDATHLRKVNTDKKVILGIQKTNGQGAGNNPSIGQESAIESKSMVVQSIKGAKVVFIITGLGGGTGTGASPVIAEQIREQGVSTIGLCTMPFSDEGEFKINIAENGFKQLVRACDSLVVIPNDNLSVHYGNLPIRKAFAKIDKIMSSLIQAIIRVMNKGSGRWTNDSSMIGDIRRILEQNRSAELLQMQWEFRKFNSTNIFFLIPKPSSAGSKLTSNLV